MPSVTRHIFLSLFYQQDTLIAVIGDAFSAASHFSLFLESTSAVFFFTFSSITNWIVFVSLSSPLVSPPLPLLFFNHQNNHHLLSPLSCREPVITLCAFCHCLQMPGRDRPRGSPWTASSITRRCCSARRTTCSTWERGRRCLPSASPTSARPGCRRMYVWL